MIYISLLAVIFALSYKALYRVMDNSKSLRKNAEQIIACLRAGEQWRADIRNAGNIAAPPSDPAGLKIQQKNGEIVYRLSEASDLVRVDPEKGAQVLLTGVKTLEWIKEARKEISVWRLEIELKSARDNPKARPLFSFISVAGTNSLSKN